MAIIRHMALLLAAGFLLALPALSAAKTPTPITIAVFGDSLTAGFRLAPRYAFPVQLQTALRKRGHNVKVINASVSGDTTGAALARLDWAIPKDTDAVIVELGANDALRGLDPKKTRATLERIVSKLKARGHEILLTGMEAPRGMGEDYIKTFAAIYPALARKYDLLLYPFFLDGVALKRGLNLDDGMHPNPQGVQVIVERILPVVEQLLERVKQRHADKPRG